MVSDVPTQPTVWAGPRATRGAKNLTAPAVDAYATVRLQYKSSYREIVRTIVWSCWLRLIAIYEQGADGLLCASLQTASLRPYEPDARERRRYVQEEPFEGQPLF
jgi:hypothetical protein